MFNYFNFVYIILIIQSCLTNKYNHVHNQGGQGYVRKITFENIMLKDVQHPVLIDQHYSAYQLNSNKNAIKISDITYRNFRGTSSMSEAVKLMCDNVVGCTNIVLDKIQITSSDPKTKTKATCLNAYGTSSASNVPIVSCLKN